MFDRAFSQNRWMLAAAVLALALAGYVAWDRWKGPPVDPLLATPMLALEVVPPGAIFFNATAHPWLLARRPELLGDALRDPAGERPRAFAQAVQEPRLFRQLDRQIRFDSIVLFGNPGEYRALLDHLITTRDFSPSYVDHWGIILQRPAAVSWEARDLAKLRERIAMLTFRERAQCLAETAVKLTALRKLDDARGLLEEARKLDGTSPHVWNGLAVLAMQQGKYKDALACVDKALAGKQEPLFAVATKTQALYATKRFSEAYDLSKVLVERMPDDPGILFYHAKICHEANAYKEEIVALERLIERATAARRPVSGYQIYLGQAYASVSDAGRAIAAFEGALGDPDLPADQRTFAQENVTRIKSRVGY